MASPNIYGSWARYANDGAKHGQQQGRQQQGRRDQQARSNGWGAKWVFDLVVRRRRRPPPAARRPPPPLPGCMHARAPPTGRCARRRSGGRAAPAPPRRPAPGFPRVLPAALARR
jgi:hypothetical protein